MYPITRDRDSIFTKIKEYNEFVEAAPIPVQIIRKYKNKQYLENETWIKLLIEGEHYISSYGRIATIQKNGITRIRSTVEKNKKNLIARINNEIYGYMCVWQDILIPLVQAIRLFTLMGTIKTIKLIILCVVPNPMLLQPIDWFAVTVQKINPYCNTR